MDPMNKAPDPEQDDNEAIMDHVALECMHAINNGDHAAFKDALHTHIAHTLTKMSDEMESSE